MTITYAREDNLDWQEFVDVLEASGLARRRPVTDRERIRKMADNAQLIVTAREIGGTLVGVARSITDWSYCLYCSELAVARLLQGQGIGKSLLSETVRHAPEVKNFVLLSAPGAVSFYEAAGYERHNDAFLFHQNT